MSPQSPYPMFCLPEPLGSSQNTVPLPGGQAAGRERTRSAHLQGNLSPSMACATPALLPLRSLAEGETPAAPDGGTRALAGRPQEPAISHRAAPPAAMLTYPLSRGPTSPLDRAGRKAGEATRHPRVVPGVVQKGVLLLHTHMSWVLALGWRMLQAAFFHSLPVPTLQCSWGRVL